MSLPLLIFNERGIYCPRADVYIDPWKPVNKAIITHGHADHSKWGHKQYLTHHKNIPIIKHRLGDIAVEGKHWGEAFSIKGVSFSLHPAGHIIGSSQVKVNYKGETWVFTGDYKVQDDGLTTPFEPQKCHTLITECTFGLPAFKWRPQDQVMDQVNNWWRENKAAGQNSILFGYTLGKAQRLLKHLDPSIGTIYTHGAIENMNRALSGLVTLPPTTLVTRELQKKDFQGALIMAPPSAHGSTWMRRFVPYVTASASGWMTFRGARRRRAIDKGFVLSDHCDWQGLLDSIKYSGAEKVICTHGYTEIFSRYLQEIGYDARTEQTQYTGEPQDTDDTANNDNSL